MATLITGPGSFLPSKVYEASSRILLQHIRGQQSIGAVLTAPIGENPEGQKDVIRTEIEIFKSPLLQARVAEQLGPEYVLESMRWRWDWLREIPGQIKGAVRDLVMLLVPGDQQSGYEETPEEGAALKIASHLEVEPILKTNIFEISFQAPDPEFAALIVNTMVDLYLKHNVTMRYEKRTREVFSQEAKRLTNLVKEAANNLTRFKRGAGIVSIEFQKQLLLERINKAKTNLNKAKVEIQESEKRIAEIKRQLSKETKAIPLSVISNRNPILNNLSEMLMQLILERAQYTEGSSTTNKLDARIASIKEELKTQENAVRSSQTTGVNSIYQALEKDLAVEESQHKGLQARFMLREQIENYQKELEELDQLEPRHRELVRDLEIKESSLAIYLRKFEESRISEILEQNQVSNVTPIEPATPPSKPIAPKKQRNLILGIIMGLIGGILMAYVKEYSRRTFISHNEVESALGLKTAAVFPVGDNHKDSNGDTDLELRRLSEAVRKPDERMRSLLITSTLGSEGSSLVAERLASQLADQESNILLITLGPGHATESVPDGIPRPATSVIHRKVIPSFSEIDALKEILSNNEYDYILVDAPALCRSPEILSLASQVDEILLVIMAEHTTAFAAGKSLEQLKEADGNVVAAVLTGYRHVIPEKIYQRFLAPTT